MSGSTKRIVICFLGILGGIAAWPVSELILSRQALFPSYLFFSAVLGAAIGLLFGIFFGTGEGIIASNKSKIISGAFAGAIIGLIGGGSGLLIGQFATFLIGETLLKSIRIFKDFSLPISRTIGWAVMGIFIGTIDGFRSKSLKKILIGLLGGFLGGITGGFVIEYLRFTFPDILYSRLTGFVIFGLLIAFFYSIVEKQFSRGALKLLNGLHKGKEFLINQHKTRIGKIKQNDIVLDYYRNIAERHADIIIKGKSVIIKQNSTTFPLYVNEEKVSETRLRYEDVIKIGSAKFFYKMK